MEREAIRGRCKDESIDSQHSKAINLTNDRVEFTKLVAFNVPVYSNWIRMTKISPWITYNEYKFSPVSCPGMSVRRLPARSLKKLFMSQGLEILKTHKSRSLEIFSISLGITVSSILRALLKVLCSLRYFG